MEVLFKHITQYLSTLDWTYILTFILLSYTMNHYTVTQFIRNTIGISIRTRFRVLLVGLLYGVFIFFVRGYSLAQIETLLASFVFAMVFHKLLIEVLIERFFRRKISESDSKEIV